MLNKEYELERISFIKRRDGADKAIEYAKFLRKTYLDTLKSSRRKFHTKNVPFRQSYIESAYSCRYILSNNLIESM